MLACYRSDIGLVRRINEDSVLFMPPNLFVVADGMGGHLAGEIASTEATKEIGTYVAANLGSVSPEILLEQAINQANKDIYNLAIQKNEYNGMGTTVTAVYINQGTIYWGHVGDSRIYHIHNNQMHQITKDHSLVGELLSNGKITKEEAKDHPNRNILTRAVGTSEDIRIDTGISYWEPGDTLLLCTDGLTTMVSEEEILNLLITKGLDCDGCLDRMVEKAKESGGHDNISVICVSYEDACL